MKIDGKVFFSLKSVPERDLLGTLTSLKTVERVFLQVLTENVPAESKNSVDFS